MISQPQKTRSINWQKLVINITHGYRSAAPHHKGVMGMLKASSHQNPGNTQSGTETTSSLEQVSFTYYGLPSIYPRMLGSSSSLYPTNCIWSDHHPDLHIT